MEISGLHFDVSPDSANVADYALIFVLWAINRAADQPEYFAPAGKPSTVRADGR